MIAIVRKPGPLITVHNTVESIARVMWYSMRFDEACINADGSTTMDDVGSDALAELVSEWRDLPEHERAVWMVRGECVYANLIEWCGGKVKTAAGGAA